MKKDTSRYLKATGLLLLLVALDRASKLLALYYLKGTSGVDIIPGLFRLDFLINEGAAFSMLQGKQIFFFILTVVVLLFLLWVYPRIPDEKRFRALRLIAVFLFAGAAGNMIDRVSQGCDIDFMNFCLIDFPIFNVADCYLTFSAIVLLCLCLFRYHDEDFDRIFHRKQQERRIDEEGNDSDSRGE